MQDLRQNNHLVITGAERPIMSPNVKRMMIIIPFKEREQWPDRILSVAQEGIQFSLKFIVVCKRHVVPLFIQFKTNRIRTRADKHQTAKRISTKT